MAYLFPDFSIYSYNTFKLKKLDHIVCIIVCIIILCIISSFTNCALKGHSFFCNIFSCEINVRKSEWCAHRIVLSKISQVRNALWTVYISLLKHFNWSPNQMSGFFFPSSFQIDKGKHLEAGPVHPLVSPGWNVLLAFTFLPCVRTGLPNAREEMSFAKGHCDGNQNTKKDNVICLYIWRDFLYSQVTLTFKYIIKFFFLL